MGPQYIAICLLGCPFGPLLPCRDSDTNPPQLCILYSVLCTLYSVLCILYSVLCTLYSVLCVNSPEAVSHVPCRFSATGITQSLNTAHETVLNTLNCTHWTAQNERPTLSYTHWTAQTERPTLHSSRHHSSLHCRTECACLQGAVQLQGLRKGVTLPCLSGEKG